MIAKSEIEKLSKKNHLGNIVEFLDHLRKPVRSDHRKAGQYPYYGANGQQGTIDDYLFDEPLILLAEDGGNFDDPERTIAYKVEGKCWVNNHAHVLRVKDGNNIDYVLYHLAFYDVCPYINGATRSKLNKSQAEKIILYTPDYEEQKRIAEILNRANSIRQKRRETLRLADEFLRSTFLEMFGDPLINYNNDNNPRLGELANINMGQSPPGNSYNSIGEGKPLLNGPAEFGEKYPKEKQWTTQPTKIATPGEILFCVRGATAGRMNWADKEYCIGRGIAAISSKGKVSAEYIYFFLHRMYKYFQSTSSGSTFINIGKESLLNLKLPHPNSCDNKRFSQIFNEIDKLKEQYKRSLQESENLFNSLMQRAFRGEL